jgi:sulfite reductase beta subunit-like hemoprotein
MISNQIDEAINKSLSQNLTPINFKLLGSSNGLVISKILGDKSMVFINAVIVNDRLGYDLNIITLDSEDKSISDRKPLLTVPLVYSGILAKHYTEKLGDIARVEI